MALIKALTGNNGEVWLDGERLATLKSIEAKLTGNFEELNFCGDNATHQAYTGYSCEGSFTLGKVDSKIMSMMASAYKSGIMPDLKITTKLADPGSKKAERVAISGIVITEVLLAKFEQKGVVEEEVPFKASNYDVLETI